MVYRFKDGSGFHGDAQRTYDTLEKIRQREGGRLETTAIVKEAHKKTSPLHKYFEWDVNKAAAAHWKYTARKLVRSIVVITDESKEAENVFFHIVTCGENNASENYYQHVEHLDQDEYDLAMREVMKRFMPYWHNVSILRKKAQSNVQRAEADYIFEKSEEIKNRIEA